MSNDAARNIRIPEKGLDYRMYRMYIERDPALLIIMHPRQHMKTFRDMKFGVSNSLGFVFDSGASA